MTWAEVGPCYEPAQWLRAFNAVMNVIQVVAIAYLSQRAYRKNQEEARKRSSQLSDD